MVLLQQVNHQHLLDSARVRVAVELVVAEVGTVVMGLM
jgi:hypothetical protein